MSSNSQTPAAEEEAKSMLAPKLRFPEFRDEEGWTLEAGDSLFDQINDRKPEPGLHVLAITQEHGAIPRHMIDYHVSVTEKSIESYKVVRVADFIISLRSFQGGIEYSRYHGICSPAYVILRRRGKGSGEYYRHYLKTDRFIRILTKNLEGLRDGKMISYSQSSELLLPTPKPDEQQTIAECLSSVDELMAAQARKVDALKSHKQGLLQQLFPREGENEPRLRFPEFQKNREWVETELGKLISIKGRIGYRGYTVADIVNPGEGAISLSPSNITESGVLGFDKATYITWAKYHESPEIMVEKEQTLLVKTGSTFGKVAYVWDLPQECTVNPQVVVLKPNLIHPYFLFLLVFGEVIQTKIRAIVVGGAIPTLSQEAVSKFKIRVPTNAEQQRIATCLSSLEALIIAETQKHEALKTHKKGLMQQLFPSTETYEP